MSAIDPLTAAGVVLATAATDAVYVMFTSAVVARRRVPAATWSSVWYVLSSYAVISYTENWIYVAFAAVGSWLGAFATITFLHRPPGGPPVGASVEWRDGRWRRHPEERPFGRVSKDEPYQPPSFETSLRGSQDHGENASPGRHHVQ